MGQLKETLIHLLGGYTLHDMLMAEHRLYDKAYKNGYNACVKELRTVMAEAEAVAVGEKSMMLQVEGYGECNSDILRQQLGVHERALVAELDKEIDRLREAQRWIPVAERLPDSGTHVLLCCEVRPGRERYVCDGYYAAPKSIVGEGDSEGVWEYDDEADEFYLLEGWYEVIKNWDDFSSITVDDFVAHWMPLPAPLEEGE